MITEKDLEEAIAECQGERHPDANTCIKLASYYVIRDHIAEKPPEVREPYPYYISGNSYDLEPKYSSQSEFGRIAQNHNPMDVMRVLDELMETLRTFDPKLYKAFIRRLTALD